MDNTTIMNSAACTHCGAEIGTACITAAGNRASAPHAARTKAAEEVTTTDEVGFVCKSCGEPSPVGVGYAVAGADAAAASEAVAECACGNSFSPTDEEVLADIAANNDFTAITTQQELAAYFTPAGKNTPAEVRTYLADAHHNAQADANTSPYIAAALPTEKDTAVMTSTAYDLAGIIHLRRKDRAGNRAYVVWSGVNTATGEYDLDGDYVDVDGVMGHIHGELGLMPVDFERITVVLPGWGVIGGCVPCTNAAGRA